ncbi:hypothetical protein pEaSNUABM5_00068 [Erwinia phage pEa_SNUABM_5]|uniref:Uncharacterized protein n=1 Tax=Erwinia phage pEa_SNUABM_5 TaxID=2797313 RepID=A0A7T8IVJ2_9CAUD|nr:hypothetical protein MPK73_gp068 [Erwinia phage pEa_SNUABM_5]QQO90210.1 hypothetical protein pEaSNUABM5_00068 [Erwinia phage pEa_SNUABM_5]
MSDWMSKLQDKKQECEQHPQWTPYWQAIQMIECAKQADHQSTEDPFSKSALEKYTPHALAVVEQQQFETIERLTESGEKWFAPDEIQIGEGPNETLPLSMAMMLPYAQAVRIADGPKSVRKTLVLIDSNGSLSEKNREQLRRCLYKLYEIEVLDDVPLMPDVEALRLLEVVEKQRLETLRAFDRCEQPDEVHLPKSQRRDFAQTRGPRPQHNAHFSKRGNHVNRNVPRRGGGRGR